MGSFAAPPGALTLFPGLGCQGGLVRAPDSASPGHQVKWPPLWSGGGQGKHKCTRPGATWDQSAPLGPSSLCGSAQPGTLVGLSGPFPTFPPPGHLAESESLSFWIVLVPEV